MPRDPDSFEHGLSSGKADLVAIADTSGARLLTVLTKAQQVGKRLKSVPLTWLEIGQDIDQQLSVLLHPQFIMDTPLDRLSRFEVYLAAIELRLERAGGRFEFDRQSRRELAAWDQALRAYWPEYPMNPKDPVAQEMRWLIEEYRVSLFAQQLGTQGKVSGKRLDSLLAQLRTQRASG